MDQQQSLYIVPNCSKSGSQGAISGVHTFCSPLLYALDFFLPFVRLADSHLYYRNRNMDSKTRHELEQNELAKWLTHQYEDWIQPNKHWLGYAILGLLIVIVIIVATARVNAWNQNAAWKQYYAALNSVNANAELELVANATSGIVGASARLALAQRQLAEGSTQVFNDKWEAVILLEKAMTSFQQVQKAANDPMILQQAGFGLGYCLETLAAVRVGDDLAKAEEEYKKVVERWENGFMGQRAQKQLALIRQPATKMFLERMAAKTTEAPAGMEGFGVNFGIDDPFFPGIVDLDKFDREETAEKPAPNPEPEVSEPTPQTIDNDAAEPNL